MLSDSISSYQNFPFICISTNLSPYWFNSLNQIFSMTKLKTEFLKQKWITYNSCGSLYISSTLSSSVVSSILWNKFQVFELNNNQTLSFKCQKQKKKQKFCDIEENSKIVFVDVDWFVFELNEKEESEVKLPNISNFVTTNQRKSITFDFLKKSIEDISSLHSSSTVKSDREEQQTFWKNWVSFISPQLCHFRICFFWEETIEFISCFHILTLSLIDSDIVLFCLRVWYFQKCNSFNVLLSSQSHWFSQYWVLYNESVNMTTATTMTIKMDVVVRIMKVLIGIFFISFKWERIVKWTCLMLKNVNITNDVFSQKKNRFCCWRGNYCG